MNLDAPNITIGLGVHNLSSHYEKERIFVNITKIEIHEDWNPATESYDADIAMLTLDRQVKFGKYIQPICLIPPDSSLLKIIEGYAVGFGMNEKMRVEDVLKFIAVPIVDNNENCFYTHEALLKISSNRTVCGGSRDGNGVCTGDSGNGLFISYKGINYLRGIVSASASVNGGCNNEQYSIFTNVVKFYEWIQEKIQKR